VVLKWSRVIKPPGKLSHCHMSNISTSGDVAVAITHEKGANEYGELTLFNSNGEIAWSKHYGDEISNPQLSDDGNTIAVQVNNNTLVAYNKRGELLWTYSIEKGQAFKNYKLSRDGKYAVIAVSEEGSRRFFSLKSHFILLRDGNEKWRKSSKGEAGDIAISPNNAYIILTSRSRYNTYVIIYTIDGAELWNSVVKGTPTYLVDAPDNVNISPDGRFFAVSAKDESEGICHIYFFENRDLLIRGVKEKLLREIDELIKR